MKISRTRLRQIIREEVTRGEPVRLDVFNRPIPIGGNTLTINTAGLKIDDTQYKIEADGPGRFNPDLTPLEAIYNAKPAGLQIKLDTPLGEKEGTISKPTLVTMVATLLVDNEWEGDVADNTLMISRA